LIAWGAPIASEKCGVLAAFTLNPFHPRRFLVSAGPTFEPIDEVRRLTNFSTGRLGTRLANHLVAAGHEVVLLRSETAVAPVPVHAIRTIGFSTTDDLRRAFEALATAEPVVVLHAAAVGDYACGGVHVRREDGTMERLTGGKVPTQAGEVWLKLAPAPKILPLLRGWFPNGRIMGWKYEVDGTREEALERGRAQLAASRSDACVVNGPAHGHGFTVVRVDSEDASMPDAKSLAEWIGRWP
jgi:phosphopantothenoylcysteine synthetase/decarboxylase